MLPHDDLLYVALTERNADYEGVFFVGVRTTDALLRFGYSPQGAVFVSHHLYGDADPATATAAWQGWLDRTFA